MEYWLRWPLGGIPVNTGRSMLYAMHMRFVALLIGCVLAVSGQSGAPPAQAVFENHCVSCHGATPMSGLDLRQRDTILKGGKRGPAIVAGKPAESLLYRAVLRQGDLKMPPGKQALASEDVERLRSWIEAGAPWAASSLATPESSWWAFRTLRGDVAPAVKKTSWIRNPIDKFILARLEEKGLHPVATADRRTLIRRAYFDLHGLPPSPEQVAEPAMVAPRASAIFAS